MSKRHQEFPGRKNERIGDVCGKMKFVCLLMIIGAALLRAEVVIDVEAFGKELGGWKARKNKAVDYVLSEAEYRTYRPVITDTPEGGKYVSVRIDHRRGVFSSDDHALLQITLGPHGELISLESSIHTQGKSIRSDVVATTGATAAQTLGADPILRAGMTLARDLSRKLAGEVRTEPGRVVFPAVIIHNYNKLMGCVAYAAPPAPAERIAEGGEAKAAEVSSTPVAEPLHRHHGLKDEGHDLDPGAPRGNPDSRHQGDDRRQ